MLCEFPLLLHLVGLQMHGCRTPGSLVLLALVTPLLALGEYTMLLRAVVPLAPSSRSHRLAAMFFRSLFVIQGHPDLLTHCIDGEPLSSLPPDLPDGLHVPLP